MIKCEPKGKKEPQACPHCEADDKHIHASRSSRSIGKRLTSILRYAYVELPKEIGIEIIVGVILAAVVASFVPIGKLIKLYLSGYLGYIFSAIFGILMYLCSTASPPLVDSLIRQGMNPGAGMALLLIGPVTSYGTILVLRKEYGIKVLAIFLTVLVVSSVLLGLGFQAIRAFWL